MSVAWMTVKVLYLNSLLFNSSLK